MDYGKRIRLVFADDGGGSEIYDINSSELITKFRLKEDNYSTYIYPFSVSIGNAPNELFIDFADFNNAQYPMTLEYLGGGALRGKDLAVDAFTITPSVSWWNLNRKGDYENIELSSISVAGEIAIGFDGKLYHAECIELASVAVAGTNALITYSSARSAHEYIELSTVAVAGTYADASGVPV